MGSILTLHITWRAFSLVCVLSVFFSFFLSSFFLFLLEFSLTDTNNSWDRRGGRWNHYFFCFPFPAANEYSFNSPKLVPLILTLSVAITRLIADETLVYSYPCMAHGWLAMHGWSEILEFYYLIWFFNVKLKLCLYCCETIPFLFLIPFSYIFVNYSF